MGFKILDASAFYAGVPFRSHDQYYTTTSIYDEIRHIKKDHDALGVLLETGRLKVMEPDRGSVQKSMDAAKRTGDLQRLSRQDMSVIALGLYMKGQIITDDYSIANVAESLGMTVYPVMTRGIRNVGRWIHYCPGCNVNQKSGSKCSVCGAILKRKFVKE